jgi:hypothetical protein
MPREVRQTPCAECEFWLVLLGHGRCKNAEVGKRSMRVQMMLEKGEIPCHWFEKRKGM